MIKIENGKVELKGFSFELLEEYFFLTYTLINKAHIPHKLLKEIVENIDKKDDIVKDNLKSDKTEKDLEKMFELLEKAMKLKKEVEEL